MTSLISLRVAQRTFVAVLASLTISVSIFAADENAAENALAAVNENAIFADEFANLENWREWNLTQIERQTDFRATESEGATVLRIESSQSASGLITKDSFETQPEMELVWRWSTETLPPARDPQKRRGDDYALRVYVVFEKKLSETNWLERLIFSGAALEDENMMPERSLCYAATGIANLPTYFNNPYTSRVCMIPVPAPEPESGSWRISRSQPYRDYIEAFGKSPPPTFRLAVMGDSDDTGGASIALLDFLRILE